MHLDDKTIQMQHAELNTPENTATPAGSTLSSSCAPMLAAAESKNRIAAHRPSQPAKNIKRCSYSAANRVAPQKAKITEKMKWTSEDWPPVCVCKENSTAMKRRYMGKVPSVTTDMFRNTRDRSPTTTMNKWP
jgi:hypothetical protein